MSATGLLGRKAKNTHLIFLTDQRKLADRLKDLGLGADDYITKPFDLPKA